MHKVLTFSFRSSIRPLMPLQQLLLGLLWILGEGLVVASGVLSPPLLLLLLLLLATVTDGA